VGGLSMKIIDLINKIANEEEIPKFWWNGCIHEVEKEYGTNKYSIFDTYCKKYKRIELEDLNDEIKFLEEEKKIPEKLNLKLDDWTTPTQCDIELSKKIDEIINYLDYLKSKGE
jgi:hypothetical protein